MFTSAEAYFTGNDVTDDVIVTKFNRGDILPPKEQSCEVSSRSDKIYSSYRVYKRRDDFTGNDVTDDVNITKFNRVHPYPPRNNPVKFHQDRIRFSRVIVFTRKCLQTTTDDRQTDRHYDNNTPRFAEG